jgi:hypothetical protein
VPRDCSEAHAIARADPRRLPQIVHSGIDAPVGERTRGLVHSSRAAFSTCAHAPVGSAEGRLRRALAPEGAGAATSTVEWAGEGQMTALFDAVERGDLELARLLLELGSNTRRTRSITRAGRAGEHGVSRPAFTSRARPGEPRGPQARLRGRRRARGSSTAGSTRTPIDACTARSRGAAGNDQATDGWLLPKRLAIASAISSGASSWM